jgi:hypothetical protein
MKSSISRVTAVFALCFGVLLSGCDLTNHETSINEEDLEVAAAIIAEALTEQSEGMFADLSDMTSDIDGEGIHYRRPTFRKNDDAPNRGGMGDFSKSFDPDTGWHTIEYTRGIGLPQFSKTMDASLRHRYTDADGDFLARPQASESLNTVEHEGSRAGQISRSGQHGGSISHSFERSSSWIVDGLASADGTVILSGSQTHSGDMQMTRPSGATMERNFFLSMSIDRATIDPAVAADEGLEVAVTGSLVYEMNMTINRSGETRVRNVAGTIDLSGDGNAILRFDDLSQAFTIGLDTAQAQRQ